MHRRLRVRHDDAALLLFVDDDAGRGLRLRHGEPAADPAQAPGDPVRPRSRRTTSRRASSRSATTAPRCRYRSCIAATSCADGTAPLLLYGYGSYGMAMPASFSANRLSLVDRGFVYAIAHIRGGADKGWNWYLDGKREKKTNTFDDFAAAGRALIERNYTSAGRIVGHGGSAGGMLMGAVANRAPRAVRRHRRRGAVRRRAEHHARRHAAADAAGMARMGQPDRRRRGVPLHPLLLALRQCRGAATIRRSWPWRASPIRASPTGSRPSGSPACARP